MKLPVTAEQLRAYLDRDWARVEDANRAHWRREIADRGPTALLHATAAQAAHIRGVAPAGTSAARRDELEHLARFKQRLDAASHAFIRRSRPR